MASVIDQTERMDIVKAIAGPGKGLGKMKKRRASPTIQLATDQTVSIPITTEVERIHNTPNRIR